MPASSEIKQTPIDPAQNPDHARFIGRIRLLMALSGAATLIGIAAVFGVIGYRVFRSEGSAPAGPDLVALLPKGAKVVSTAVTPDRIVVTLDLAGATEIRTFDLHSLKGTGRLRFATEP
jgi:hypothetical protein